MTRYQNNAIDKKSKMASHTVVWPTHIGAFCGKRIKKKEKVKLLRKDAQTTVISKCVFTHKWDKI